MEMDNDYESNLIVQEEVYARLSHQLSFELFCQFADLLNSNNIDYLIELVNKRIETIKSRK
jgi:hypothetical protein